MQTDVALDDEVFEESPAMRRLTHKQKRFVEYVLDHPTCDWRAATVHAGYANGTESSLTAATFGLRHNDRIIAALTEMGSKRLAAGSIVFLSGLLEVASDPTHKDRTQMIKLGLALTGYVETTRHELAIEHRMDPGEAIERLKLLADRRGIEHKVLLDQVIDVPCEPVDEHQIELDKMLEAP